MPSGAAQLASHSGGRCRHRGAVIGCRVPRTLRPERGCAASRRPPPWWPFRMSGYRPRRPSLCSHPLSAMRTDVRPTGRADVRCPRVQCPRDRCDADVRTDRRPVSATAAAVLSAPHGSRNAPVPRDWPRWAHRVRRVAVVGERLGRRCPNQACREGWSCVGQCVAGTSGDGRPGPPLRTGKGGGAALTAWATKGVGAALGDGRVAGGTGRSRCAHVAPPVHPEQVAGVVRDMGLDREVVTTVSGRCAGVGPVSSGSGGPIRFGGEQPAAAARPRYVRSAVRSALTAR
jgi:hypothetical protein